MKNLLKATFKTGSSSIINILLGIISTKIMAIILGSNGIGLLSLIRQTLQTTSTLGTIGGQTALVQGLASKEGTDRDKYLITVFWIFLGGAIFVAIGLLLFAPWLAKAIFSATDTLTINLVRWMALPSILIIIFSYLTSLLNGFRAIGRLAIGQIIVSVVTLFLVYPISKVVSSGYTIAFIWMISASNMLGIIFCLIVISKEKWLSPLIRSYKPQLDKKAIKHFYKISGTTLITGLITTSTLLILRVLIVKYVGLDSAGIFDVAWTLSMTYVMIVLSSFGTYYLPTLSEIKDVESRIIVMQDTLRLSTLLIVPLITTIIVLKPLIIHILYSNAFIPALEIIQWMLIGDYFKVVGYVFAMPILAYPNMKVFFWTEIFWDIGFLSLSVMSIMFYNNLQGIGIAFMIFYFLILLYYLHYANIVHQFPITKTSFFSWIPGLLLIIIASWQTWGDTQVNWISAPFWIIVAIGFSWMTLSRGERNKLINLICKKGDLI